MVERASIYRSLNLPLESMSRNVSFGWNKAWKIWLSYIGPGENLDGRPLQVLGSLGGGFYIYDELSYLWYNCSRTCDIMILHAFLLLWYSLCFTSLLVLDAEDLKYCLLCQSGMSFLRTWNSVCFILILFELDSQKCMVDSHAEHSLGNACCCQPAQNCYISEIAGSCIVLPLGTERRQLQFHGNRMLLPVGRTVG